MDRKQRFFRVFFPPWMTSGHQIGGTVIDGELIIDIDKTTDKVRLVHFISEGIQPVANSIAYFAILRVRLLGIQRNMYHS